MQLGMVGLGRMGANIAQRLMRGGHECVVYDVSDEAVKGVAFTTSTSAPAAASGASSAATA